MSDYHAMWEDACEDLERAKKKIKELEEIIDWTWYYIAYLLGMYTDEEFEEVSDIFAREARVGKKE